MKPNLPSSSGRPRRAAALLAALLFAQALAAGPADEVATAERARQRALVAGDADALAAVLSDELQYLHPRGLAETKAEQVAALRERRVAYTRYDVRDLKVRLLGADAAVATGEFAQRKLGNGEWREGTLRFHAVWRREAAGWRLFSFQSMQPPAAK